MPESKDVVKRLDDTHTLLDVMIQVEDYLDSLDLYVFDNWIEGVVVDGPFVKRYWVTFTLQYPYKKMPDPQGGLRLLKYGSKVAFEKATEEVPVAVKSEQDVDPMTRRPKIKKEPIWLIHFKIPRRFIEELDVEGLDLYDEEPPEEESTVVGEPEAAPAGDMEAPAEEGATSEDVSGLDLEI